MTLPDRKDCYLNHDSNSRGRNIGAALGYLRLGWCPIPLCWPTDDGRCGCGRGHTGKDIGKAPLLGKGYQSRRVDERDVRLWWRLWPKANIGILLAPSGLLVADADGPAGVAELEAKRPLPVGPVSISGGGGEYRWYEAPSGIARRSTHRGQSRSLDILAAGYVVAPPSRHRSGTFYEWLISPAEEMPPPAPAWAVELLAQTAIPTTTTAGPSCGRMPRCIAPIDLACLPLSNRVRQLLVSGANTNAYASRSEALFAAIAALVRAGADDAAIATVIWSSPAGEKAREKGEKWLAEEIVRVRTKVTLGEAVEVVWQTIPEPRRPQGVPLSPPARPQAVPFEQYVGEGNSNEGE